MRAAYNGQETLTFTDYIDQETGRTLTAEPGMSYDIAPASGRPVADVPEPWFTALDGEAAAPVAVEDAAAEDAGEPLAEVAPDAAAEPPEPQKF